MKTIRYLLASILMGICAISMAAPPSPSDIQTWTRQANAGNVTAQYALGYSYMKGDGVDKNRAESLKWFRMAAENGHPLSMYLVGGAYFSGDGLEKNNSESEKWMLKAANLGQKDAAKILVFFYRDGEAMPEVPKDAAKAKYWQDVMEGRIVLAAPAPAPVAPKPVESRLGGELVTDANLPPNVARAVDYLSSRSNRAVFFLKNQYLIVVETDDTATAFPLNAADFKAYTETGTNIYGGVVSADHVVIQCPQGIECITSSRVYRSGTYCLRYADETDVRYFFDWKVDDGIYNAIGLLTSYVRKTYGKWTPKFKYDEFGGSRKLVNFPNIQGWSETAGKGC